MIVTPEERFEVLAPKQNPGETRYEIALRPAQDRPQVIFLFELANRITRHDKILHGSGVVRRSSQPCGLEQGTDPARLHLFRATHDELGFREVKGSGDSEIADAGNKSVPPANDPTPEI